MNQEEQAMQKQAEAVNAVMEEIYVPAFVKSCADRGVQFHSDEQLKQALETTAQIEAIEAAQAAENDPIKQAHAAITSLTGGIPQVAQPQARELSPTAIEALTALAGVGE